MILLLVDVNNRYLSGIEEQVGKKINMNISFHSIFFSFSEPILNKILDIFVREY